MFEESGTIFYQDPEENGGAFYRTTWETVGDQIDIITITSIPYVWGQEAQGFIKNGILFRYGIVSIIRQVIKVLESGYEIIAEGSSQYYDYVQMNFPCGSGPQDRFRYHLNSSIIDQTSLEVSDGPHWVDPDNPGSNTIWSDGSASESLVWVDVWS